MCRLVGVDRNTFQRIVDDANYNADQIKELRDRQEYEDGLLNARMSIVLVFNGLMAAAANLRIENQSTIALAGLTLAVDGFWIVCSLQHGKYMKLLSRIIRESKHKPTSEELRLWLFENRRVITPSFFMTTILPFLLVAGWVAWIALKVLM